MRAKYGAGIEPIPEKFPELHIDEESFFIPMSPYAIVRQLVLMHMDELPVMKMGDVQSFRDWSHVEDIAD